MTNKSLRELTQDEVALQAEISGLLEDDDQAAAQEKFQELLANELATEEKIARYFRIMDEREHRANVCEAEYESAKKIIERYKTRARVTTNDLKSMKERLIYHMEAKGIDVIECDTGRIKLCDTAASVKVPKEQLMLPEDWATVSEDYYGIELKWSKKALVAAHKAGKTMPKDVEVTTGKRLSRT